MRWNLKEAVSKSLVRRTEITYKARLREISWLETTKSDNYHFCSMAGDLDRQRSHAIITYELARYSSIARRILMKNRDFLDAIANTLLEKHYLLRSDIQRLEESMSITRGGSEFDW